MPNQSAMVRVGSPKVGGYAFSAALGTAVPTNATTALAAAYGTGLLGYIPSDGLTRSTAVDTEDIQDWNLDVVRVVVTDKSAEFTCTLIEMNENVLKEVYGATNVTVTTGAFDIAYDGEPLPHKQYAFELKDGARVGRIAINDGQIINVGDVSYTKSAVIGHEVTIKCFLDASNKFFHEYWADAA